MTGAKRAQRHAHKMKCGQGGHLIHKFSSRNRIDAIVAKCCALSTSNMLNVCCLSTCGLTFATRPVVGARVASEVKPWVFW